MRFKISNGKKRIHWACNQCIVRACCTRFCDNAELPFGFDDFPKKFMNRLEHIMKRDFISHFQRNNTLLFQVAEKPDEFRRISSKI